MRKKTKKNLRSYLNRNRARKKKKKKKPIAQEQTAKIISCNNSKTSQGNMCLAYLFWKVVTSSKIVQPNKTALKMKAAIALQ